MTLDKGKLNRRDFIKTGLGAAAALSTPWLLDGCSTPGKAGKGSAQPNILFVLTDCQGWPTLGSYE